jgi:hypothetical protein
MSPVRQLIPEHEVDFPIILGAKTAGNGSGKTRCVMSTSLFSTCECIDQDWYHRCRHGRKSLVISLGICVYVMSTFEI